MVRVGARGHVRRDVPQWEAWTAPTDEDEWRLVRVEQVDLTGIPEEFAGHWPRGLTWEQWLEREPIYLRREYNSRTVGGVWQRLYVGIGNGRHRLLHASLRGVETLRVQVLQCAFFPAGDRPPDREDVGSGDRCFEHDDFDAARREWLPSPTPDHEQTVDCGDH